jgi:GMP synthase-like glutamine amidotransferase
MSLVLSLSNDSYICFFYFYLSIESNKINDSFVVLIYILKLFKVMSKKVLIIQHSTGVCPAYVTIFFSGNNIPYEILPISDSDYQSKLPDNNTNDYSVIVSLGGPQGSYEDDIYPYLKCEKSFLAAQLALNTPILGLCLGAQLIADAIGGHCHKGKYGYEIGYVEYELTAEGKTDPVISKVFEEQGNKPLFVMHHKDSFDLPSNATILAYTSNNYIAAFRTGSALCLQFHPEATFSDFNRWVTRRRQNSPEVYGHLDVDEILRHAQTCENEAAKSTQLFFETWWNSLQKQQ